MQERELRMMLRKVSEQHRRFFLRRETFGNRLGFSGNRNARDGMRDFAGQRAFLDVNERFRNRTECRRHVAWPNNGFVRDFHQ